MQNSNFVAINYISCNESYKDRFEELFKTRAHAIDRIPGFHYMEVLKPKDIESEYLIISHWENEDCFTNWQVSPEFKEGHKRGFEDIRKAKSEGKESPLKSVFKTYDVFTQ
jgi:heme-degrading monooxygenase HmoA